MAPTLPSVLLVVPDPTQRRRLCALLQPGNFRLVTADTPAAAWDLLATPGDTPDALVLGHLTPPDDALTLVHRIKSSTAIHFLPVVLWRNDTDPQEVLAALSAGAHYALSDPGDEAQLLPLTRACVEESRRLRLSGPPWTPDDAASETWNERLFHFRTLDEAGTLAARLASLCPRPDITMTGLTELMYNAVEHGNLGITYQEKSRLVNENLWEDEIQRRLELPEFRHRLASVQVLRQPDRVVFIIRDSGPGFDWRTFMNMDMKRRLDNHGRGIAMAARFSFDELTYRPPGNCVIAVVRR
ncbi:MAG: ATP-binding protein [Magnetococcus sp. WYHC-3]